MPKHSSAIRRNGSRRGAVDASFVDADVLAAALRGKIRGEVRFDDGDRALYATDGSNYRQIPIGVVVPKDNEDVVQAVAVARRYGAPILARGGGTSLAGQCCNVAVVIDMSKYMNEVLWIDADRKLARVQAGTVLDTLQNAVKPYGLTFGPDPATHSHCTLGGMIGNNSCGIHSVQAQFAGTGPRTSDNIHELEILTYDGVQMTVGPTSEEELKRIIDAGGRQGEIYAQLKSLIDRNGDLIEERYPDIPRLVSGYENLDYLLRDRGFNVARALGGTECTCALVLEATVNLIPEPPRRSLLVLGYPDIYSAGDHIPEIMAHEPVGLEGVDDNLVRAQQKRDMHVEALDTLPAGNGWLFVELGGETKKESDARAHELMDALKKQDNPPAMKLFDEPETEFKLWEVRESALGATAQVPGELNTWPGWEDSAVPPDKVGDYLRDLRKLLDEYSYFGALYGHFGQGCIHSRISFDMRTAEGLDKYHSFVEEASDLVLSYGGTLSGEHGDGQARGELLPKMYGPEMMDVFRDFKSIWDPGWKMNPGKVIDADPMLSHLRLGTDYDPPEPDTHFRYPNDNYNFARAALRCVGVGKCRRLGSENASDATMCPSFMVTREEKHSTRGRARLLFEMLEGDAIHAGWQSEPVKEALDLCLACKGCKSNCPVSVDMATYKAEFLSHYYAGRLRPRSAYAFGLIHWWSELASHMPGLANFFTQTPILRGAAKAVAGVAPERRIPPFAHQTFRDWFLQRGAPDGNDRPRVILWPDTFNNFFHPETAQAAVEVLENAGYDVIIPQQSLCCGRPLYDYGMLKLAKRLLRDILDALDSEIAAGVPIVGLEPSCVAVFRDELVGLLPNNQNAMRLRHQTFTLSEFLVREGYRPPQLKRKALVHGHCHHHAIMGMHSEEQLLSDLGLDYTLLNSGCCGMAGSFGFEKGDRYAVSIKAGERVLLPAVREAAQDTLIIAEGFSCREQIAQETQRHAVHTAEVLQMALREGPDGPRRDRYPEVGYATAAGSRRGTLALLAGGLVAGGALSWKLRDEIRGRLHNGS